MAPYFATTLTFAWLQLKRHLRSPATLVILVLLPVVLLLVFGGLYRESGTNLSLEVAVINATDNEFARDFERRLRGFTFLSIAEKKLALAEVAEEIQSNELDGIIELPAGFGEPNANGLPAGNIRIHFNESTPQVGQLLLSLMRGAVEVQNAELTGSSLPLSVDLAPTKAPTVSAFAWVFSAIVGAALIMLSVFGLSSQLPVDKKVGVLRRLHATPFRASQLLLGSMLSFLVIGFVAMLLMTLSAWLLFDFHIRGSLVTYSTFLLLSLVLTLGLGAAIGGWSRSQMESGVLGQIVFFVSMALSGVWFPRFLQPDWLQAVSALLPFSPVIDGLRFITAEGHSLAELAPQLTVIGVWTVVVHAFGSRLFRWE